MFWGIANNVSFKYDTGSYAIVYIRKEKGNLK